MAPPVAPSCALPCRVLHVLASGRGGGAVHVRTLTTGLARRGVPVTVAFPLDDGHLDSNELAQRGVTIMPWSRSGTVDSVRALAAIVRATTPGLIHTHGSRAATLTWAALALARAARVPRIHSVHGFVTPYHRQPRRSVQNLAERLIARASYAVIAASRHERAALHDAAIGTRVVLLPQGVELDRLAGLGADAHATARRTLGLAETALVVVAVCRLDRPRDFPRLLRGFGELVRSHPSAHLLLVGDGPERGSIEKLIDALGLRAHATLVGQQIDVAPFYAAADIYVSTSYGWEALGLATIEAQAAALAVVVTDAGGATEAFAPNVTGLAVPMRDPNALAGALRRLADDPSLRQSMGRAGRSYVTERFAVEPMIDAVLQIYRAAIGDHAPQRA